MARKRMIHPDFFISATMNDVQPHTMLTFAGIWCWADDYGRGENDESLVKAAVWARRRTMTEKKVRADMDALTARGVLCEYEVNGHRLVHVTNWSEHQKVSHPTDSKLPPCPAHEPDEFEEFGRQSDPATDKFRTGSRGVRENLRSAS